MRGRIDLTRTEDGYELRPTVTQMALLRTVVSFMDDLPVSDSALRVQVGQDHTGVRRLLERLNGSGERGPVLLDEAALHTVHASLMVAWNQVLSEEAFYRQLSFFRENVLTVAQAIAQAVEETNSREQR
ncbi:hypothetical protein ACWD5R_45740 [Streptomyces sp. NPDC002514]|uniref:hypothetical protein n=1 Tax=unclassified Streptomyces TaxID=2593676 RepID=UPI003698A49E